MSAYYPRGGLPAKLTGTAVTTSYEMFAWPGGASREVWIKAGATPILVVFGDKDAAPTDARAWTVAATATEKFPAEAVSCWLKSTGGNSDFELLAFVIRG